MSIQHKLEILKEFYQNFRRNDIALKFGITSNSLTTTEEQSGKTC